VDAAGHLLIGYEKARGGQDYMLTDETKQAAESRSSPTREQQPQCVGSWRTTYRSLPRLTLHDKLGHLAARDIY
jgi:hypothetical protein